MSATQRSPQTADVLVENHGSVFVFTPLTAAAREFVEEHVHLESYQWLGASFAVEHRYARDLAQGMIDDGLEVR